MNTWKVILATLVIFSAGVLAGGLLNKRTQTVQPTHTLVAQHPPTAEVPVAGTNQRFNIPGQLLKGTPMRKEFIKDLDCEVHLTPEQRAKIEKILCDGQECTKKLWEEVAPEFHKKWVGVKEKIRSELNEEQQARFEAFMSRPRKSEEKKQTIQLPELHREAEVLEGPPSPQCDEQCGNLLLQVISNSKL